MDEELFVHLTTVGALWYSRLLYAFESSEERTGSADGAWLKRYIVPDLYQTLVKKTNTPLGPVGLESFFLFCLLRLFTNSCQSLQFRSTLYQFLKLSLVVRLRPL